MRLHIYMLNLLPTDRSSLLHKVVDPALVVMEFSGCPKRNIDGAPSCPRCASSNTKFCYFNNYSFSQPRYFCKSCRRYWTKGGSLRNVPVGGASRKSRPAKPSRHSPQTSRLSISVISCSHDTPNSGDPESGGSHIDMALLFAKFINQNSTSHQEFHRQPMNGSSDSVTSESAEAQKDESRRLSDPVADSHHEVTEGLPQQEAARNFSEYELDGLFGADEAVQDVLWSDDTTSSALAWQPPSPMMAFPQELEYSMSTAMPFHDDDQFPITSTVLPPI